MQIFQVFIDLYKFSNVEDTDSYIVLKCFPSHWSLGPEWKMIAKPNPPGPYTCVKNDSKTSIV